MIVCATREGRKVYWGYIDQAAQRFKFNVDVIAAKLSSEGTFKCVAPDPLKEGDTAVYVLHQVKDGDNE